ncbi:uncharacterized protein N7503_004661 [Penicillium pulvis]|uniref:uncharacterized protein n=1 Tax=Penicillium pulvis TaxID=1562058 RepID=UPI0025483115|nr:uncharacterized protein N7503_004661 [Penicillium pulvis]KAJ5802211.1 hypothetical protein N7503_004661 [Penicillium pulvis]
MDSTSESSVWTFFLGPGRVKQTIHSDLARHVSPELEKFVKEKSVVKDSKLGSGSVVTLEEFDAETFAAFWAYTYRGDYKAPKPPVHREEKTRRESALSPTGTWRGMYRSESMSSGVPPPAPSPPGSVSSASRSPEPEPEPEHQSKASPVAGEEPLAETQMEDIPVEDTPVMPEDASYEVVEPVEAEAQPDVEADAAPAAKTDPWDSPKDTKNKKGKKGKKGKKKDQEFTEEAPVNFTPPSTPPPEFPADLDDAQLGVPEQTAETNPVDWYDEPSAPAEPEPAYDAPTPAEPEPELETVVEAEKPTEEWEQAEEHAPEEAPQEPWEVDVEDQNQAPTKPSIDMSFAKQSQADSSPRTPGLSLWGEFAALQYNDEQTPTQTPTTSETEVPYLTFHAKVYVFATRFLIPSLAQLCLRKLHRALLSLALEDADAMTPILDSQPLGDLATLQAPMVLDLLRYTYTHTDRLEPISETVATQIRENELRRLVVHYAACKLKSLARYHSPGDSEAVTPAVRPMEAKNERSENALPRNLRVLLDTTPELASDVVYRMM